MAINMCAFALREAIRTYAGIPDITSFCVVFERYYTVTFEDGVVVTIFHSDRVVTINDLARLMVDKYCYQVNEYGFDCK